MERILSKEEIAELLSAVKQGDVETLAEGDDSFGEGPAAAVRYDLVQAPGPDRWKLPNLDLVCDAFGRNVSASLTNRLQRSVTVTLEGIESLKFEPALERLTPWGLLGILSLEPLKTSGLMVVDEFLSFVLLELQLGGGTDGKVLTPRRTMTAIEINILKMVISVFCADLQKAFEPVIKLSPQISKVENNPRLVSIVPAEAGVAVVRYKLEIEDKAGIISLILPHATLEPLREKMRDSVLSNSAQRHDNWSERIYGGVSLMKAQVAGQVAEISLRMREILNFQVGDVIELGLVPSSQVRVLVEGKHKFSGQVGVRNGVKAVRISEVIFQGEDNGEK